MELARLSDGDALLARIDDEERARKLLHLFDAAEILLELLHLVTEHLNLFLREDIERAVLFHRLELLETLHALLDRLEVRHHAAEPTLVDIELTGALRLGLDGLLRLLLRADEEDALALLSDAAQERVSLVHLLDRLLQVNDIDAVALREDVLRHLRVPAARLMSEMDACLE